MSLSITSSHRELPQDRSLPYEIAGHQDIGFAEIQRYYNVYAFNDPLFYQTSSNGTDQPLTTYPTVEIFQPNRNFWKPTQLYDF